MARFWGAQGRRAVVWTLRIGMIVAPAFVVSAPAEAEQGLYINEDNKAWKLVKTFAFSEDCDKEARSIMRSGKVLGAGCAPYQTTVFSDRGRTAQNERAPQKQASTNQKVQQGKGSQGEVTDKPKTQAEIMKDKDVQYYQRVYEGARQSAKGQTGGAAYSNGNSYAGQNVRDASANLQKAKDAAASK
jgi:hypothetical protein